MRHIRKTVRTFFFFITVLLALDIGDLYHDNQELFFVNPEIGEIRLKARKDSIERITLVGKNQSVEMEIRFQDDYFDYYVAAPGAFDTSFRYHFVVKTISDSVVFPPEGEFKPGAVSYHVPEWAKGRIYYLVFVDRFKNGSLLNDPPGKKPWGSKPAESSIYGGDLRGVIDQLSYIDSLDVDGLILSPILSAPSGHKFDFIDDRAIDAAFGDTSDLKMLISEMHSRKKKIILMLTFTHTGVEFPAFSDVIKNNAASSYFNWYLIKSQPVRQVNTCYDCWRSDERFPRLNLNEPEVVRYLLNNLEFWCKFDFDGFYIGADSSMNADFLKKLRSEFKLKYPDRLIVGNEAEPQNGEGFDGSSSVRITRLVLDYFGKSQISTSQFDRELHKLLFWNPAQANAINLLNASDFDSRVRNSVRTAQIRNLYAFLFTFCGSPVITYGDEVGMTEAAPLDLGSFVSNVNDQDRNLLQLIKRLIGLRKTAPEFANSYFFTLYTNDMTRVYAYDRGGIVTILNSGLSAVYVEVPVWDGTYVDLLNGDSYKAANQQLKISVPPESFRILKREF